MTLKELRAASGDPFYWKQRWGGDQLAQRCWKGLENPALDVADFGSSLKNPGVIWYLFSLASHDYSVSIFQLFGRICKTLDIWEFSCWKLESNAAGTEESPKSTVYKMQRHYVNISIKPTCASSCFSPAVNVVFICILQCIIIIFKCAFPYLSGCTSFCPHNTFHISYPLCLIHRFRNTIIFCWHLHHFDSWNELKPLQQEVIYETLNKKPFPPPRASIVSFHFLLKPYYSCPKKTCIIQSKSWKSNSKS